MSHDMTLLPGDVIACGTSLGVGSIRDGGRRRGSSIEGIGSLKNTLAPVAGAPASMMTDTAFTAPPRALLRQMFDAAIASAQPDLCIRRICRRPARRLIVVAPARHPRQWRAASKALGGQVLGFVVTRYGLHRPLRPHRNRRVGTSGARCGRDEGGAAHARYRQDLHADDLVLCLIREAGSALFALPAKVSRSTSTKTNRRLLASGASISDQLRSPPPLGDQEAVGRRLLPGASAGTHHLRRGGGQPVDIARVRRLAIRPPAPMRSPSCARYGIDLPDAALECLRSGRW